MKARTAPEGGSQNLAGQRDRNNCTAREAVRACLDRACDELALAVGGALICGDDQLATIVRGCHDLVLDAAHIAGLGFGDRPEVPPLAWRTVLLNQQDRHEPRKEGESTSFSGLPETDVESTTVSAVAA